MRQARSFDKEYKVQAVKLAKVKGTKKAAEELGVPVNTLSGWVCKAKNGKIDLGLGKPHETVLMLVATNGKLRRQLNEHDKEIKRINELNKFLEETSSFFAAIHRKSGDGMNKGKISFYCKALKVLQQAFYDYFENQNKPWKHGHLTELAKA